MAQSGRIHVVKLRRLRNELRRAREVAGLTQKQVAEDLGWSISKVIRLETGAANIVTADVMALLQEYHVADQARIDRLVAITRQREQTWWWDEYREYFEQDSPQFLHYLAFEDSAIEIRQFHGLIIPGLLQTERYIRALMGTLNDSYTAEAGIRVRLRRQELIRRDDPPKLWFVLDEAAIHRVIGGYDVMVEQLRYIRSVNELPNADIQIIPYTAGTIEGMNRSFTVLDLSDQGEEDNVDYIVNVEDIWQDTLIRDSPDATSDYVEAFFKVRDSALSVPETNELIDSAIERMLSAGS